MLRATSPKYRDRVEHARVPPLPPLPRSPKLLQVATSLSAWDGSSYREWLESPRMQTMPWWRAPSDELLSQYNPARLKGSTRTS
jgi:hypothetical protein